MMHWVTREHIGVDRMATAWLITRFIDTSPEFAFVREGSPVPSSDEGVAFDIPGAHLSHRRGHCTFHAALAEYQLQDPVLGRLARIIDEADIVQEAPLEPLAPGLDVVCRGLRLISADDHEAITRSASIFDGLYAYLKQEVVQR